MAVKSTISSDPKKKNRKPKQKKPPRPIDKKKIRDGVRLILEGIGEDLNREGLQKTPQRVADFYEEAFAGIGVDPRQKVNLYTADNRDELIIVRDISFYSMCEHHLLPFFGKAHIAYIPGHNKITGFSHLARVIETLAHRPTTQEVLTSEAVNVLRRIIQPKGILIVTEIRAAYPNRFEFKASHFDRLCGTSAVRNAITNDSSLRSLKESWQSGLKEFLQIRKRYLLYTN